jgi:hypothetical protein
MTIRHTNISLFRRVTISICIGLFIIMHTNLLSFFIKCNVIFEVFDVLSPVGLSAKETDIPNTSPPFFARPR